MSEIIYTKLSNNIISFKKAYIGDACYDIRAYTPQENIIIQPTKWKLIPTGIMMDIPLGIEAQIRPRSGLAAKFGITVLNSPGTIDPGFKGEIQVILINHGQKPFTVYNELKIAQICFGRIKQTELQFREASVDELENLQIKHIHKEKDPIILPQNDTSNKTRENKGFGSSGMD